jgi:hypothetical protein
MSKPIPGVKDVGPVHDARLYAVLTHAHPMSMCNCCAPHVIWIDCKQSLDDKMFQHRPMTDGMQYVT